MSMAISAGAPRSMFQQVLRVLLWTFVATIVLGATIFAVVYVKTLPAVSVADRFHTHLANGNVAAAFELTSVKFRKTTNIEALNRAVSDHQLDKFKSVFWYERYINGTGDAAVVRLAGTLSRLDGSSTPVAMRFVWIGNWVIDEVEGAGFGVARKDRPANR